MRTLLALLGLALSAHSICYYPNGAVSRQDTPCRNDLDQSACCGQGFACLSNGMCKTTGREQDTPPDTNYLRGSCTDRSWRSGNCPSFCLQENMDNIGAASGVQACPGDYSETRFFCINKQADGCRIAGKVLVFPCKSLSPYRPGTNVDIRGEYETDNERCQAPTVVTTIGYQANIPSSGSSTTATSTPPSTQSVPPMDPDGRMGNNNNNDNNNNKSSSSSGSSGSSSATQVGVGIGVGVGVGIPVLAGAGAALIVMNRRRRKAAAASQFVGPTEQFKNQEPREMAHSAETQVMMPRHELST
ncbi:hypothetical protein DCS_01523 [Drechmeria coniospora]|uniref:Mid2 domain-containing protein n=1 Tax=Drechmeria coniospora TaxID=98403 RepID=A0A151GTD8_DRECN|nr:hypothetical protein DCS_01523 [Drechmeria coniospora]KYK60386.1 hypothetical protein DCS_01523 [Drechmeria coniospora]